MIDRVIILPEFSLVALVGVSGAGKTTFARRHFLPTQILTSDRFRALVSDNENSMEASGDAFEVLYTVAQKRLSRGILTVIDATNIQDYARRELLDLAARYGAAPVAIVLDVPEEICIARTLKRTDRPFGADVVMEHFKEFYQTMEMIQDEGFQSVNILNGQKEIDGAIISVNDEPLSQLREILPLSLDATISLPG